MNNNPTRYKLIDTTTGKTVGTYATAELARSERDRKDWQHGAMRYRIKSPKMPAAPNTPTHPQGWAFKGSASGYCVWHAGKNDYRVTAPGGFDEVAQCAQFGIAFAKATHKADAAKAP